MALTGSAACHLPMRHPCRPPPPRADCLAAKQAEDSLPRGCKCVDISAPVCAASGLVLPNQCTSLVGGQSGSRAGLGRSSSMAAGMGAAHNVDRYIGCGC